MQIITTDLRTSSIVLRNGYYNHETGLGEVILHRMFELTFKFSRKKEATMALAKVEAWHKKVLRLLSKNNAAKVSALLFADFQPSSEIRTITGYVTVATEGGTAFLDLLARRRVSRISVDIEEIPIQSLFSIYDAQRKALSTRH